uniref:Uncharacterized protein n=1 Tax=Oryza sativa subsp. japonica TaxID=39947 RepID=Q10HV8_ORYSJ|nr:hypothetical protein LOC_Os03g37760 [Oryza sativa Japonica Group]
MEVRSGGSKWWQHKDEGQRRRGGQPLAVSFLDLVGEKGVRDTGGRQRRWLAEAMMAGKGGCFSWSRSGRQPRVGSRFRLELADEVAGVGRRGFSGDESWLVVLLLGEVVVGDMVRSFGKPQVMVNNSVVGGLIIGK